MELLDSDFSERAEVLEKTFSLIDECIDLYQLKAETDDFHKMCGLALVKAKHLALGAYSLILDGLGQEAGALLRPFIEYFELLVYFRMDPSRVQQAIDDRLPSAGKRAELIEGSFKKFRAHLNQHASHSAYSHYALNHLLDKPSMKFRKTQPMLPIVLDRNMGDLFVQLALLLIEAGKILQTKEPGCADSLAEKIDALKEEGLDVFKMREKLAESDD